MRERGWASISKTFKATLSYPSPKSSVHDDYVFLICLTEEDFKDIPDTILCQERLMMVVVEGRWLHCWNYKQIGHLAKACPQKNTKTTDTTKENSLKEAAIEVTNPGPEPENPLSPENGWTQDLRKKIKGDAPKKPEAPTLKKYSKSEEPESTFLA